MSDETDDRSIPTGEPLVIPAVRTEPLEEIGRGLFFAIAAVLGGIALTVVLWRIGFIASISSYALAAGAVYLYVKGAGATPRKGLVWLMLLIVLGVVAAFFGVVASDAWDAYGTVATPESRLSFIANNIFRGQVLGNYGKDMAMFALFAGLGIFSTMRRLLAVSARR